jgi:histolysain
MKFSPMEELRRRAIFMNNAKLVQEFNKQSTFELSLEGPYAAMTNDEYKRLLKKHVPQEDLPVHKVEKKGIPSSVDWRSKMPAVRDQGQCGSCYSFGSLACLEGRLIIFKGASSSINLAEQQIVDCSQSYGNNGCEGGTGSAVYNYIAKYGVTTESNYPYTQSVGTCKSVSAYAKVSGSKSTGRKDCNALKENLAEAPVDVSIDASSVAFQLYKSGVYTDTKCKNDLFSLNHEVCAVGYGSSSGKNYIIVRNSWGTSWGMSGYIYMESDSNTCGVCTDPIIPTNPTLA